MSRCEEMRDVVRMLGYHDGRLQLGDDYLCLKLFVGMNCSLVKLLAEICLSGVFERAARGPLPGLRTSARGYH